MEQTLLKQQKELEELRMEVGNVYQTKNDIKRQVYLKHAQMDINLQKQMTFNEELNKPLKETKKEKIFKYDNIFIENDEFKKHNILLQVKFKALSMEEKDVDLWWDAVQDIVQKEIGKVCRRYERNERLYMHKISLDGEGHAII